MFEIELNVKITKYQEIKQKKRSRFDHIIALLYEAGKRLSKTEGIRLHVSGFGDPEWSVSVYTELPILLEQLPPAIHAIESGVCNFNIDFFEQGVERYIAFSRTDETVIADCKSLSINWEPNPSQERMTTIYIEKMLKEIYNDFNMALSIVCPDLFDHQIYRDWLLQYGLPTRLNCRGE